MINFKDIIRVIFSKENKEALYIGIGNLSSAIIGVIFWLLLASIVNASIYGEINYYIAVATLASIFVSIGLDIPSITSLARGEEQLFRDAIMLVLITSTLASLIVGMILSSLPLGLLIIGNALFIMAVASIIGKKRYKRYPIFMLLLRTSQLLLAIILYLIMSIDGLILGYAIPTLASGSLILSNLKGVKDAIRFTYLRKKIKFIISTYIYQLSTSTLLYIDKLVIAPFFGFAILGLYQFAFQLLIFLSLIPMSLIQYLLPEEASKVERKDVKIFGIALASILSLLSFFLFPLIIEVYFKVYLDAILASRIMAFAIIPMTLNNILNAELLAREKSIIAMSASLAYIFLLILLLLKLGGIFGLVGLALSTLLASILQTLVLLSMKSRNL